MEQPVEPKQTPQSEPVNNSVSPVEPNVKVEEPQKSSTGISKKVLLLCIIALFVSIALLVGFTMGQKTATTDKAETPVVSQPIVEENEEVTSSALTTLDPEFDYYLMNDCGVAVPKIANYDYKNLPTIDEGRYWKLNNYNEDPTSDSDTFYIDVSFSPTPKSLSEESLSYAYGYIPAYFSVECTPLPSGVENVDEIFSYLNNKAQASSNNPMKLYNLGKVSMWGQEVIKFYASEGMYTSEDNPTYIMVYKGKYVQIWSLTQTSSEEVSDDLQAQLDAIVFY